MEGGRWRHPVVQKAARVIALGLAACVGLVVALVVATPLILRGRVLRWVVARAGAPLCGTFELEDGHLGWTLVPDLLLGRAFSVELDGVRVAAPDGTEVMAARHVSARVTLARAAKRVVVDDAVATRGLWRLAIGGPRGSGFLDAFRAVPAGGDRAACVARAVVGAAPASPKPPTAPAAPSAPKGSLQVNELRLDGIDVDLEFPSWGLALPGVHATGTLTLGAPGSGGALFDARDAQAAGGVLRVGNVGGAQTTRARFDDVVIGRVAITADRATDMTLVVKRARTGRADLTGTAVFENVVPIPGSRAPRPPPGITLDARWEDAADALDRLEAAWLPPGATLEGVGLGGLITARLRGPFQALSGALMAEGPRARIEATLEHGVRATTDVRATRLDLTPLLDAGSRPAFGGALTGRLRAGVTFGPRPADLDATIDAADITLARARAGTGPRALTFHVGPQGRGDSPPASTAETLTLALSRARFHDRTLALEGLRMAWATAKVSGGLALTFPKGAPTSTPAPTPPLPRLDATLRLGVASLARFVPATTADARLAATVHVTGPLDHERASITFAPSSRLSLGGARFRLPRAATATLDDGRVVTLSSVVFTHEGGGTLEAHGHGEVGARGGTLAGTLRVKGYPLAQLPGLGDVLVPAALAHGRATSLARALAGTLDATGTLAGTSARPTLALAVTLSDVALAGRALGDGRLDVHARPDDVALTGTLGPAVAFEATVQPRPQGLTAEASVTLKDLALGPWLPAVVAGLPLAASGEGHLSVAPRRAPVARGEVRVVGAGNDLTLAGHAAGEDVTGTMRGRVELGAAHALWSPWLAEADGALTLALAATVAPGTRPRVSGSVEIARALRVRAVGWPRDVAVGVDAGGRLDGVDTRWHTAGLDVTTDGARARVSGDVDVDLAAPERSRIAIVTRARLDAATLARHVPQLTSAAGTLTLDARAAGEAHAPVASGEARLEHVELRTKAPGWPTLRLDGTIEAGGHELRTRDLRVETGAAGVLTIGTTDTPAQIDVASWLPFVAARVDVPVVGSGLHLGDARTSFEISDLDLALHLVGDPRTSLTLTGDVGVARARLDTGRGAPAKPGPSRPWYAGLPPRLTLDLTLHGPDDALVVAVPGPDVTLGFRCHVRASAGGATLSGRLRGGTVYSRLALAVYDWTKPQDVRECRVFKE